MHTPKSIAESQDMKIQQSLAWNFLCTKCKIFVMAL